MGTVLTTPVPKNATQATLESIHIEVQRDPTLAVIPESSAITGVLLFRLADGTVIDKQVIGVNASDLTAPQRTLIRNFWNAYRDFLRTKGFLPAGVDSQDI